MESTTIIIVDDDPLILKLVSAYLKMHNINVTTATDGEKALKLIKEVKPELIIADVEMPGMGGHELCREVRAMGYDNIPFFFCSSASSLNERMAGLEAGADDYLVKPISPPELLLKIKSQITKARKFRSMEQQIQIRERQDTQSVMSGKLGETDVPGLLQVINMLGHSSTYINIDNNGTIGEIYLADGNIVHATLKEFSSQKALFRILGWNTGSFRVEKKVCEIEPTMCERLEHYLLDSVAQIDEFRHLYSRISGQGKKVLIVAEQTDGTNEYHSYLIEMIKLFDNLDQILDESELSDPETLQIIMELIDNNIIVMLDYLEEALDESELPDPSTL